MIFQLNAGMLSSICTYNIFIVQGLGAEINEYTTHPTLTAIQNFNHGTVFQILVNMYPGIWIKIWISSSQEFIHWFRSKNQDRLNPSECSDLKFYSHDNRIKKIMDD